MNSASPDTQSAEAQNPPVDKKKKWVGGWVAGGEEGAWVVVLVGGSMVVVSAAVVAHANVEHVFTTATIVTLGTSTFCLIKGRGV